MIALLRHLSDRSLAVVSVLGISTIAVATASGAINPAEWRHRQELAIASAGLTKVALPIETLDLASDGLADLRVVGPSQEEMPFVVEAPALPKASRVPARRFQVELQKLATQLTIETGVDELVEGIELATPTRDFVKAAKLEISLDGKTWELVSEGIQLASGYGIDQRIIRFNRTSAPWIRLTIDDWRTPVVAFTGANILVPPAERTPSVAVEGVISKRDEFASETVLTLTLPARHLPLAAVEFQVHDPVFSRPVRITERRLIGGESVEQVLASGFISRYQSPQQALREQLRLPLNFTSTTRELEIHIENASSAPLTIERINAWRRPVWLTLSTDRPGNFSLLTGNPDIAAPHYDLARFGADVRLLPETQAVIGPPTPNPGYQPVDRLAPTAMFGAPLDPAHWRYRKGITLPGPGVQELELDLEVLAHSAESFGDLRLMSDGQQVPYVLERTSLWRSLTLAAQPSNDPARPRVSHWTVSLPVDHLPISRLSLSAETALFSRTVQIFETIRDERGETYRRTLAGPFQWDATPERTNRSITVALNSRPQDANLEIEIDNGDNAPISLSDVKAAYPVTRLLFRSTSKSLELYYGFDQAAAPRYDLQLVAGYLLNQPRLQAKAGAEENLRSAGSTLFSSAHAGPILWASLGLVVVVLLIVIARLLPKQPTTAEK